MWFEIAVIVIGLLIVLWILTRNKGTKTKDLFRKYVYDYIPRMMKEHDLGMVDLYMKKLKNSQRADDNDAESTPEIAKESKGETECRRVLEMLFKRPFSKTRPSFLNNDVTLQNLELDCFNEELKLACEYQGEPHFKYIPYFHKSLEAFRNQQYRDYMKKQKCKENGINLIEVSFLVPHGEIEQNIIKQLTRLGYIEQD